MNGFHAAQGSNPVLDRLVRAFLFLLLWFIHGMGIISLVALGAVLGLGASTQDLAGPGFGWLNWVAWSLGLIFTLLAYRGVTRRQGD